MADKPFLAKFKAIIDQTDLSQVSKDNYKYRLERLTKITGKDVDWIMNNCKKTMKKLREKDITEPQSQKAMINAVLTIFKHVEGLKEDWKVGYTCWVDHFKEVNTKAQEKYETLEPSKRQIEAYVPWAQIIKARDEMDKSGQDYLVMCLYTMLPPARADFNRVRIVKEKDVTEKLVKENPNHLVIMSNGMKLVYNEFKTKSKKLQKYEKVLPKELVSIIKKSLKKNPREYLVVIEKTGAPYIKANSFSHYMRRLLFKLFEKPMSINTLRHSFVNSIDMNTITPMEKESLAKDMMHSPEMFDRYRLSIPAKESEDGKAKVCDVVCRDA